MRPWKILCDFDGTVSTPDATDVLLEHYAAAKWKDFERAWREGLIGSRECMSRQVELIDASEQDLNRVLDRIRIDPAFPQFVAQTRARGVELVIVSDGLDQAIQRILDNHDLGDLPVVANRLEQVGERRWKMQSPHAEAGCRVRSGTCKCACADRQASADASNILLIGDGQSDICVAARADFVFAKSRLLEHCLEAGIPHRPIAGFGDAAAWLPDLLSGRLDAGPLSPSLLPSQRIEYA